MELSTQGKFVQLRPLNLRQDRHRCDLAREQKGFERTMQPCEDGGKSILLCRVGEKIRMIRRLIVSEGGEWSEVVDPRLRWSLSGTEEERPDRKAAKLRSRQNGRY